MLCVYYGGFGKADLCLKSLNLKASVEYRIASCMFRNEFSLVNDIFTIIDDTIKCDIYQYNYFFQWCTMCL
jgi:hypothetical protein